MRGKIDITGSLKSNSMLRRQLVCDFDEYSINTYKNPAFDSDGFIKYQKSLANTMFNRLIDCVKELNAAIAADDALGEGFCIGHSYFCNIQPDSQPDLSFIVEYEILPLISEYWFDDRPTVNKWADRLQGAIR